MLREAMAQATEAQDLVPGNTTTFITMVDTLFLTAEKSFTRTSVAGFSGFSPTNGYIGDTITLTGTFYDKTPVVSFGDAVAKVKSKKLRILRACV